MSKKPLIIIGARGCGKETIWLARDLTSEWEVTGILDDDEQLQDQSIDNVPVLGRVADWIRFSDMWFIVAIGSPRVKKTVVNQMLALGTPQFAVLTADSVLKSQSVSIGAGSIIAAGCILTTNIIIGEHCILNRQATLGHDIRMGDYSVVAPQSVLSGNVTLGNGAEVGANASVLQDILLGEGSLVAMGAAVIHNVDPNTLVAGCPASVKKSLQPF